MRQTLFYVPHELFGVPIFGLGWALGVWLVSSIVVLFVLQRRHGWTSELLGYLPLMSLLGLALYALLPSLEVHPQGMAPLGLPIRGYGMFVLAGIIAGMSLSIYRVKQIGKDPELIYSLAFWMFIMAIAGARLFYVVQKWDEFVRDSPVATIGAILKFTEGGLVVYGSVIGGMLALYLFSRRHELSMFEIGDIIAPGMAIGLAFGRIGCLMNGCCYGGICEGWPLAITFPQYASTELGHYSPPYAHQLTIGELYGFRLGRDELGDVVVVQVDPGSKAEAAGLSVGTKVERINGQQVTTLNSARQILLRAGSPDILINNDQFAWSIGGLPKRSRPVHPTQIYSSINAALLCLVVWFAYPFRRRHGEILFLLLTLYSIARFLLEAIRKDEAGQFGTTLTISQLVSLGVLSVCVGFWIWLLRQPTLSNKSVASA